MKNKARGGKKSYMTSRLNYYLVKCRTFLSRAKRHKHVDIISFNRKNIACLVTFPIEFCLILLLLNLKSEGIISYDSLLQLTSFREDTFIFLTSA